MGKRNSFSLIFILFFLNLMKSINSGSNFFLLIIKLERKLLNLIEHKIKK